MIYSGMIRPVDRMGRVSIPKVLRDSVGINDKDKLEMYQYGEEIHVRKYESPNACMITGKVSDDNIRFADGSIVLSREVLHDVYFELLKKFF